MFNPASGIFLPGKAIMFRLFSVFLRIGTLNELAYRTNFWVQLFESIVNSAMALGTVGVVFARTDTLGNWNVWELVALIGVYFIMLGLINLVLSPSLNVFMKDVQEGTLDFTLTKPADAQILVSISQFQLWKLIDVLLGVGTLGYAVWRLGETVGILDALLFVLTLILGAAIVYSFWMILATLVFWFIRIENILMIFWSMYQAGRWPVGIYPAWLKWILTAIVPIAFAVTVPAEAISGRLTGPTLIGAAALAVVLVVLSRQFWKFGLKYYSGASA